MKQKTAAKKNKAQVDISSIIAFMLFLSAVVLMIVYVQYSSNYATLKNQEMFKSTTLIVKERLESQLKEEVYMYSIGLSNFSSNYPVEFFYNFSFQNTNADSTVVLNSTFDTIPVDIDENTIIFTARNSQKPYFFVAIPTGYSANKSSLSYSSDLDNGTDYINNTQVYVEFKNTGIESIMFYGSEILSQDKCLLSTTSFNSITPGYARTKGNLNGGNRTATIYQNNSLVLIESLFQFNSNITFVNYTYFYNGTQNTFNTSQNQSVWTGTADFIDLYNSDSGVAIIGENLSIEIITNKTYWRKINIAGANKYRIIPHNGNYTVGIELKEKHLADKYTGLGPKKKIIGATNNSLAALFQTDYHELKKQIGLSGANINITFPGKNMSFGRVIPDNKAVYVFNYPFVFIDRYANKTLSLMKIAIWKGVE